MILKNICFYHDSSKDYPLPYTDTAALGGAESPAGGH